MKTILISITFILISTVQLFAGYISGRITDTQGAPLAYANVYVKNTSYGASSNLKGNYFLELKKGSYTIVYSFVGYESLEKDIIINEKEAVKLNVVLKEASHELTEFEVVVKKEDRSKEILKNVRENRKYYLSQVNSYSCKSYQKTSLEKELIKIKAKDSIISKKDTLKEVSGDMLAHLKKQKMNLIESVSETYFKSPSTYKEIVLAHHDYIQKKVNVDQSAEVSVGIEYGQHDIAPTRFRAENPYLVYTDIASCDFNFYKNNIDYPAISNKPLLSPIAASSMLSYTYKFLESFEEDGHVIYKIQVNPIFESEALFSGVLYIEDSSWMLKSVDLSINRATLFFCKEFRIIQNYEEITKDAYLPVRREFTYTIKDGRYNYLGNTRINHSNYEINPDFEAKFFNNEIKRYEVDAFDKDSTYWQEERPLTLQIEELDFIRKSDSIQEYFVSDEYYHKIDSAFNRINWWWFWLTGVGHRNRAKGNEFYVSGLVEQINPLGIGGYRHKLPGYYNKDFKNGMKLETRGFIDYGFNNKDIKGQLGIGLTYLPLKFVRTFIDIGDFYTQINEFASFEQIFSRSNYVRKKSVIITQRMEIVNGLFGELTLDYSDQDPIKDLQLSEWSEIIFGEINKPTDFVRYKKAEVKLELKYRFKQKYILKNGRKIIIGTDYPELDFIYRKGIPNLFNSEVDYDYIELGAHYDMDLARLGSSRWRVLAGSFINKKNLRVLEHKYFRGSDYFFFSDPLQSFQLMGPTLSTADEYFRANYIHHFEGTIMNKIPLINRLKLGLSAGAGTLIIPDINFRHFEVFAGIERAIRIKQQLFRFGIYAVTADNSFESADFTWKFGIDFFNSFTNKWGY
ncbi:MAG: carboxypeptidase-like regulatory domain-containing protein [Bacteroidetes bacterium]|nr:carboxypeptidase-like regulatory domain-containing protein [Bacteroidota bacterium]